MKTIKLMADYNCHPLWGTAPEDLGDISPEELPISSELKHSLRQWAERYDAILNMDDPMLSGFKNEREEKNLLMMVINWLFFFRKSLGIVIILFTILNIK